MPSVPNPHNDFIPVPGQKVKIIGGCHPKLLDLVVEVVAVYNSTCDVRFYHPILKTWVTTSGQLGGLKPE